MAAKPMPPRLNGGLAPSPPTAPGTYSSSTPAIQRVRRVSPDGVVTTVAGGGGAVLGDGGPQFKGS